MFRLTYYDCNDKQRKSSYVELFGYSPGEHTNESWNYCSENLTPLYKCYNGLKDYKRTARTLVHLFNEVIM